MACATDTSELAELFGDETNLYADSHDDDLAGVTMAVFVARHLGHGSSRLRRIGMVGKFLATAGRSVQQVMESHCQSASELAAGSSWVTTCARRSSRRSSAGTARACPASSGHDDLALAIRLVQLADSIEAFHHAGGADAAMSGDERRAPSSIPTSSTASAPDPA